MSFIIIFVTLSFSISRPGLAQPKAGLGFAFVSFFYRAMLCIRGTSHGPVSVSVCVCLSVTSRSFTKTAKRRIIQTTPHDSPGSLVFWRQRSPRNSTGLTPTRAPNAGGVGQNRRLLTNRSPRNSTGVTPTRAPNAGGVGQNRRLLTNNRLYLENGTR